MISLEETFVRDFHCEQLQELPSDGLPRYYYPGGVPEGGHDGLIVHVCPRTFTPWLGIFRFGDLLFKGKNGFYSWPDPGILCVVARAQGYTVRVEEPNKYEVVDVHPIIDVIPVGSRRLVVFASYTELVAYGESGLVWVSDRLSWDGFTVTAVTDENIKGNAWDPSVERDVGFRVDLRNGHREDD
jgi:hypothetical protein